MYKIYIPIEERPQSKYRWVMLAMAAFTPMFVFAMPMMSLPVLFSEIAEDLNLSLVQIGVIWGINSLTSMFVGLIAGTFGDRFGTRRSLFWACLATGILGASRGFSNDLFSLIATSLLMGLVVPAVPIYVNKIAVEWFDRKQLGMATGFVSAGFATGLTLGAFFGANVLSPQLGGWRNVFFFYGGIAIVFAVLWWLIHPQEVDHPEGQARKYISIRQALPHVMTLRSIWMIGLGALGVRACVAGMTGYLPTYLRAIGWTASSADNALAGFFAVSLIGVIPISIISDRMGLRRQFLVVAALVLGVGTLALTIAEGQMVWVAVMASGFVFDAFMAMYNASIMESEGVGPMYAGTALGFAGILRNLGGTFSPPIGNSLARFGLHVPFAFWGLMAIFGLLVFLRLPKNNPSPVPHHTS